MILVPTIHPAAVLRAGDDEASGLSKYKHVIEHDIRRAVELIHRRPQWDEAAIWEQDTTGRYRALFPNSVQEVYDFCRRASGRLLSIDIETTGLSVLDCVLLCVGMASETGAVLNVPLVVGGGKFERYWTAGDERRVREALAWILADEETPKCFQNYCFDTTGLLVEGMPVHGHIDDTMTAQHCLDGEMPANLAYISSMRTEMPFWKDMGKGDERWINLDPVDLRSYCLRDTLAVLRSLPSMLAEIRQLQLERLYRMEIRLAGIMRRAMWRGLEIDLERRDDPTIEDAPAARYYGQPRGLGPRLQAQYDAALKALRVLAGDPGFKIQGPKLTKFLFETLKFPVVAYTKKGNPSTDKNAMALLQLHAEAEEQKAGLQNLVVARKTGKYLSTWIHGRDFQPHHADGRIHPFWKLLAISGRFTSSPNAQNTPGWIKHIICAGRERDSAGQPIKRLQQVRQKDGAVIERLDWVFTHDFVSVDLSQAELRAMAYYADDPELNRMYREGINVHTANTTLTFGIRCPPEAPADHLNAATEDYLREKIRELHADFPSDYQEPDYDKLPTVMGKTAKDISETWKGIRTLTKNEVFGCLAADTDVRVFDALGLHKVKIKDVKPGLEVVCYDFGLDRGVTTRVKRAWTVGVRPCVQLVARDRYNGDVIRVVLTPNHRMLLADGTSRAAGTLVFGDELLSGQRGLSVMLVEPTAARDVWDLEVEDPSHNFMRAGGAHGLFVGNSNYGAYAETVYEVIRAKRDPNTDKVLFPTLKVDAIEAFQELWFGTLHQPIKAWHRKIEEHVINQGYYRSPLSGRILWCRGGFKRNLLLNFPIQEFVAAHMERMAEIADALDDVTDGTAAVVSQVHDAINVESPKRWTKTVGEILKETMNKPFDFLPPNGFTATRGAVLPAEDATVGHYLDEV